MGEVPEKIAIAIDPTYGQRSFVPDYDGDEEVDVTEAVAYLNEVRSEAGTIPHILVAKYRLSTNYEYKDDGQGFYEDGAYAAVETSSQDTPDYDLDNQTACYQMIRTRFLSLRTSLGFPSMSRANAGSISAALDRHANYNKYSHAFLYTSPSAREVSFLDQDEVIHVLIRYEQLITKRNFMLGDQECSCLGAWGWALLAKSRPVCEMDSEAVSVVRDVGKAAVKTMKKFRTEGHMAKDDEESYGTLSSDQLKDLATIKARELRASHTLDALITIVGEEFGQRDLLNARAVW